MANKQSRLKRMLSMVLALNMIGTAVSFSSTGINAEAPADNTAAGSETEASSTNAVDEGSKGKYSTYLNNHSGAAKPNKQIYTNASDYKTADFVDSNGEKVTLENFSDDTAKKIQYSKYLEYMSAGDNGYENLKGFLEDSTDLDSSDLKSIKWKSDRLNLTYEIDVPETGLYNLEMIYYPIEGTETTNTVLDVGLKIDGDYPFSSTMDLTLDRLWKDESVIKKDSKDNDLRPGQVTYDCWMKYPVKDKEGLYNEPYFFYLEAGKHTITLEGIKTYAVFHSFTFKNYEATPSYQKPTDEQINDTPALTTKNEELGSNTVFLQAEIAEYKTASTLYATYDRTSYLTNPSHPTKQRYNTLGAATWNKATQAVTYKFSVENDGYYRINVKARQNTMRGFYSNRRFYIDGKVLCEELDDVKFAYNPNWYTQVIKDNEGNDLYIWLKGGEEHTLTMEAIPGSIGAVMQRLDDLVLELNYYYRRILMITGPSPDEFNDYMVDLTIPELLPAFEKISKELREEKAGIEELSQGSEAAALETLAIYLDRCISEPDEIPQMASSIKESISSVSAWMRDYRDQPLELDYIEIGTVHEEFSTANSNFIDDFLFGFNAFIGSFFEDYTVMSDASSTSLNVWVSLARDQATVIKSLVDNKFNSNPEYEGIEASINLVQGSILEASLAGKGPEVALFLGGDFPIQLAARGLLVDVTSFKDYDTVKNRFANDAMMLYTYNNGSSDGVYGLPVSQNFPMMFYRTDVLSELGYDAPPETWDDLIEMLPTLQRKYLEVGLILPQNISSNIFDAGNTFVLLMLQSDLDIYADDLLTTDYSNISKQEIKGLQLTNFQQQKAVEVFTKWTKFYTVYNFQQTYDAFSRFRTGEMPILIQPYTFYNQLSVAAPEIKGLWDFALVPGTEREDGTISHATNSAGAGAVIFSKVSNQSAAWTFIKWFTSSDVQVEYGKQIEALMGPMGRFDTANQEALTQLPWSITEYEKISAQQSELREIPIIPSSYAVTRHINNAFRAVVNDAGNPRYTLTSYNDQIKSEIVRKYQELASMKS